ncbi:MAG: 5'-nucleotidase C-terminal domain-containing protein, partial [Erysipelotrichaceae bacterium]|nr:5'-nucleotidase C-terminal domain-containing protein [Erysipelotrichaceae bacterium]
EGKDVLLSSVGTKMANVGELFIGKDGTLETMLISEYDREDETIKENIAKEEAALTELLSVKVSHTDFDLSITDENGIRLVRSREVGLANLVADAWRDYLGTDIVIVNGGSVRKTIPAGDITHQNVIDVLPFMNSLSICIATGQQILDSLEFTSRFTEGLTSFDEKEVGEFGGFLQVSGLKYTIDTSVPTPVVLDENKMFVSIEGERRVKDVMILQDGEYVPIDPEKIYSVGSSDYVLFNMGDGNTVFTNCEPIIKAGPTDSEVIIRKIMTIGSIDERYKTTEGRITVE